MLPMTAALRVKLPKKTEMPGRAVPRREIMDEGLSMASTRELKREPERIVTNTLVN
jgi:hypothetical protein